MSVSLAACGDNGTPVATREPAVSPAASENAWVQEPVVLRLTDYLQVADVQRPLGQIGFDDPGDANVLSAGWNRMESSGGVWTMTRDAVIDVPIVRPADMTIRLDLNRHPYTIKSGRFPDQVVKILWNDHEVGRYKLRKTSNPIKLTIPAKWQNLGLNRLDLLPFYWFTPQAAGIGGDIRSLGIQCSRIRFFPDQKEVGGPRIAARVQGDSIMQLPGSVISYYFLVPTGAVLRGEGTLILPDGQKLSSADGRVRITLMDEHDIEHEISTHILADMIEDPHLSFEKNLSDWEGRMIGLNLSFSVLKGPENRKERSTIQLQWNDPRIEGYRLTPPEEPVAALRDRYNVIIMLSDALRADHIEPYGSTRVKTAELTRLAAEGTTFMHAYANSSWTRPSVASVLTSAYPSVHKIFSAEDSLDSSLPYLPEIMHDLGYRTMAILSNPHITREFGFDRGFDVFHPHYQIRSKVEKEKTTPEAKEQFFWSEYFEPFLAECGDQPFFIYYHEMNPHDPFNPPAPYNTMYDAGRGNIDLMKSTGKIIREGVFDVDEGDARYLQSQYMGEITFLDEHIGRLRDHLEQAGVADRTLFIFIADHGEEFWDHQDIGHGRTLYREVLDVPLIFELNAVIPSGLRSSIPAQQIDVAPTILDLIGEKAPARMQGRSLLPYILSPDYVEVNRATYAQIRGKELVRLGHWKFIEESIQGAVHRKLFNVEDDPDEMIDRWPQKRVVGKTLEQILRAERIGAMRLQAGAPEKVPLKDMDPDVVQDLRDLGYLN